MTGGAKERAADPRPGAFGDGRLLRCRTSQAAQPQSFMSFKSTILVFVPSCSHPLPLAHSVAAPSVLSEPAPLARGARGKILGNAFSKKGSAKRSGAALPAPSAGPLARTWRAAFEARKVQCSIKRNPIQSRICTRVREEFPFEGHRMTDRVRERDFRVLVVETTESSDRGGSRLRGQASRVERRPTSREQNLLTCSQYLTEHRFRIRWYRPWKAAQPPETARR